MGFASGPVSFQRFFATTDLPADLTADLLEKIQGRAFGRSPTLSDNTQMGWIGPAHLFETQIEAERINVGRFLHLGLRVDRLAAPPSVLRAYVRIEEEAALQVSGRSFLSKGEKRKAKGAALTRIEAEMRAGNFRRMNAYPVLIDLEQGVVYLGTLGVATADKLMQVFSETFGCALEPADPERVALRAVGGVKNGRLLEGLTPFHLAKPPEGYADPGGELPAGDVNFLGNELLTWLWYQTDADDGPLALRSGDEVTVMLDRSLRMKCAYGLTGVDVITADGPTRLPEARAALRIGKQPTKAGVVLGGAAGEYRFSLDGSRMAVSGLQLPESELQEADALVRLEARFEAVVDAADLLDALFELFVRTRTGRDWAGVQRRMSAWAAGKSEPGPLRAASA